MKKSILIAVLTVTLIISFSLVSLAAENWGNINWKQFAGTELNIICYKSGTTDRFIPKWKEFTAQTGIKVNYQQFVDADRKKIELVDFATGRGQFDVVVVGIANREEFAVPGYLEPLDKYLNDPKLTDLEWYNFEDYTKDIIGGGITKAGDLVYIPWAAQYYALWYRTDIFDQLGLKPPTTWDEYVQVTKALDDARKAGKITAYAYVDRALPGSSEGGWSMFCTASCMGLELVDFDNMVSNMNTPKGIEFMDWYTSWLMNYGPPGCSNWTWPEIAQAISQGQIAMCRAGVSSYKPVEDPATSIVAGKIGYVPPVMKDGGKDPLWEWGWGINAASKVKEAAWLAIEWITSPNVMNEVGPLYGTPARASVYDLPAFKEAMPSAQLLDTIKWMLAQGLDPDSQMNNVKYAEASDIISKEMNSVVAGIKDVKTACADIDTAFEKLGIKPAAK
jgi:ABC-type glycerol-3-phosphate transport system substrate-binding protein